MLLNIKDLRKKRNLSQTQLAEMAGISVSYLSEIETGKKAPNTRRIQSIAAALGVTPIDLLGTNALTDDLKTHIINLDQLSDDERVQVFQYAAALAFQKSSTQENP